MTIYENSSRSYNSHALPSCISSIKVELVNNALIIIWLHNLEGVYTIINFYGGFIYLKRVVLVEGNNVYETSLES